MFDSKLLLRNGAVAGNLTATATGTGVDVQESPAHGYTFLVVVPQATGTSPTLNIAIQMSDDDATYVAIATIPQITAKGIYSAHVAVAQRYVRAVFTVAGTTPNFGAVTMGIVPDQPRFWNA